MGFTSDGTPLRALLDALGAEASQAVRETLIAGLATGENPRAIARRVKGEFDGNLARALRVARTETLRAYRTAALRNYRANDDVVKGWIWLAAVQGRGAGRTCASCWAMHGTTHSLDEIMDDHPNGRCAAAPWVRSWAELGFEGLPEWSETPKGVDLFARLTPQEQDRVLGAAGGAAYRAGAVKMEQFVGVRYSARWGSLRYARSLTAVLGPEEAKRWEEKASADLRREQFHIGEARITRERQSHWRAQHPEVTEEIEKVMLSRAILRPEYETRDPKDATVIRRYTRDARGKWWRVVIKMDATGGSYVLTFHRVHGRGK